MSKQDCIDFGTWYSGMERSKVEASYNRYETEILVKKKNICAHCNKTETEKGLAYCSECLSSEWWKDTYQKKPTIDTGSTFEV